MTGSNRDVFINCPFDRAYQPKLHAIVVHDLSVELQGEVFPRGRQRGRQSLRQDLWYKYGIHDISRTEVNGDPPLPRFNMPLELGLFLGFCLAGNKRQRQKRCIVFDKERYRYQRFISDIAGQDIHCHDDDERRLITELASWLREQSGDSKVPGGSVIAHEFADFSVRLPAVLDDRRLAMEEVTFSDYTSIVAKYLAIVDV